MAVGFTLSRNLKLRLDSTLTANALYNLQKLDLLGSTFLVDTTESLNIRSRTDISIEPNSADLGGSGTGGSVSIGNSAHSLASLNIYSSSVSLSGPISLLDQATVGNKYLNIQYKSDISGLVDTTANRSLSVDLDGADRSLVLGGNLSTTGGNLSLTLTANSSVTLPTSGTLATLAGVETLTNKSIDAGSNSLTNITNSSISSSAAIVYSKLSLANSILNSDINTAAAIAYTKLNLTHSIVDSDVSSAAGIIRTKIASGNPNQVVINDSSGFLTSEPTLAKSRGGAGSDMTSVTFPSSGLLVTADGSQVLTNKTIDGLLNTVTNIDASSLDLTDAITNSDINTAAGIAYSKLNLSNSIMNSDINSAAAIARSKIANGTASEVVINSGAGALTSEPQLAITRGGTGQATANAALNALLPSQVSNVGRVLQTDGTNSSWAAVGTGSVTSVALAVPAEFSVSGSPITTSGTLTVTKVNQNANLVYAGPGSGGAAQPSFRSLVAADIPDLSTIYQPLDSDLTALAGLSSSGVLVRIGSGTATTRTLTASTGISISNGDGVSGNPTISSTITQYTDEQAQDAVGTILTDTSSVDFTYNDAGNTISAVVLPAGVDHNQLLNFVANKHIDHSAVQIGTSSTSGLTGGGDITTTRNISVAPNQATSVPPDGADLILFADVSNSNALRNTTISAIIGTSKVTATWAPGDGTSKSVTHNLNSTDISINLYIIDTGEEILADTTIRTSVNAISLTSSQAPTGSGWGIVIRR